MSRRMKTCLILALVVTAFILGGCANDDYHSTTTQTETHSTVGYGK